MEMEMMEGKEVMVAVGNVKEVVVVMVVMLLAMRMLCVVVMGL